MSATREQLVSFPVPVCLGDEKNNGRAWGEICGGDGREAVRGNGRREGVTSWPGHKDSEWNSQLGE